MRPGDRVFLPVERLLYRAGRIDPEREQPWTVYALSLLAFSAVSVLGLYLLQRVQGALPLNPTDVAAVPPALAFNTAASFVTNTNWQNYGGESTMAHLTQMAGLTVQNFVSAAVGIAVVVALIRGLTRRRSETIGNFWVDLTRITTRILLPLAIVIALAARQPRRRPDASRKRHGDDRGGRDTGDLPRAGREPGGDQGARDERRRDRERELGASVREPDRVHEPRAAVRDPADPVRPDLRVRADGRRSAPGLGDLRRDVRPLGGLGLRRHGLRARRQPTDRCVRGEHGGQGGAVRRGGLRPVCGHDYRDLDRSRDRGPRQLHAAAAAPCRS